MQRSKLGIGIVGLGMIARSHAAGYRAMEDLVDIRGVCDVDGSRSTLFAQEFGGQPYQTLDAMLGDPAIEAVDLVLPHHLHYDAAMAVIAAGRHLLLEKPLAPTYLQAKEICSAASGAGITFMVAENTRYIAGYVAAERILAGGAIGEVNHARTYLSSNEKARLSTPGWWGREYRSGGGLILDTAAHSFYLLKWLLGDFRSLQASASQVFPIDDVEIEDTVDVVGALASGAHFVCGFTSVSEIPHSERLELYGTAGGLIVDQMATPVVKVFRGHLDFQGSAVEEVPYGPEGWRPGGWHYESVVSEISDFVHSVVDHRPPLVDPDDCAYAIAGIEAAYESIRSGLPVTITTGENNARRGQQ